MILLPLLLGCAPPAAPPVARAVPGGVRVEGAAMDRVVLRNATGVPLLTRRNPSPLSTVTLPYRWQGGDALTVEVQRDDQRWTVPVDVPAQVTPLQVEALVPVGQAAVALAGGETLPLSRVPGASVTVGVAVSAEAAGPVTFTAGEQRATGAVSAPGAAALVTLALPAADAPGHAVIPAQVQAPGGDLRFTLDVETVPLDEAQRRLALVDVVFPADQLGRVDLAREPGQITLPSPLWQRGVRALGLGYRPRDGTLPWAWEGVTLRNSGDTPINVVISARVLDADGVADPTFRPRLRDAEDGTGTVRALLRVPAGGEATAALPVFVDEATLGAGPWTREVQITPLGAQAPLQTWTGPLAARRGSAWLSAGLVVSLLAGATGVLAVVRRGPAFLRASTTSDLMTVALFGALAFTVGAAAQLVGMGVAAVLGPFSAFLLGIIDDALRTALWTALLALLPRPGVAALALVLGWLLRVFLLGSMGPMDLLFVGAHITWLEGCLWVLGLTRGADVHAPGWGLRAGLAFGGASALVTATGLVLSAVFYRLYYAPWFVGALIAGPGFLYSFVAAILAVRFARALREVDA